MSAQDNLNHAQFFHGTAHDFAPGELVERGHRRPESVYTGSKVFASEDLRRAKEYAHEAAGVGQIPKVYAVTPTGPHAPALEQHAWASEAPYKVSGEVWRHGPGPCDKWGCRVL